MPFLPWDEFLDKPLGDLQLPGQMARGTVDFACDIWNDYTSYFYEATPSLPFGNFAVRQFWNTLCYSPPDLPLTPPPPPFLGGQCDFRYALTGTVDVFPSSVNCTRDPSAVSNLSGTFWGPILSVFVAEPFGACGGFRSVKIECHGIGANARLAAPVVLNVLSSPYGRFLQLNDVTLTPVGGVPDVCGDPPTDYDTINPPPAPGELTYDIVLEGDKTNNFTPTLIWNEIDFSVPIKFDFQVGDVTLDLGGVDINFDLGNDWKLNDRDAPPPTAPDLYEPPENLEEDPSPDDQTDADETDDPSIRFVQIEITTSPLFGRQNTILQPNPEDSTFFAGYFCWTYQGAKFPDQPIRKLKNIYRNDVGADGFRYYSINGAGLKHTIYRTLEE